MIFVSVDITAPLYWWKEFDTYKVGTVANSCSTMHKLHSKAFERADFSMDETYYDKAGVVLHTPISAFGGEKDGEADESAICEWGKYTDNDFDYRIFPGGHFYLRDYEDEVISEVERRLQGMKNGG